MNLYLRTWQQLFDSFAELANSLPSASRAENGIRIVPAQNHHLIRIGQVALVYDELFPNISCTDVVQHLTHSGDLALWVRIGAIDDMHQQVGLVGLLKSRPESLHKISRQMPNEPNCVGKRVDPTIGGLSAPGRRIQSREQRVFHQHTGIGEFIQQRRFAGVSVSNNRYRRHLATVTFCSFDLSCAI